MPKNPVKLLIETRQLPLADPVRISGHVFAEIAVVKVALSDGKKLGRGEASGVYYLNDDAAAMRAAIEVARPAIEAGIDREDLRTLMPAGGARNAVDAALWELEANRSGRPVWKIAGLATAPRPVITTFTVGADEPAVMAARARAFDNPRALKLKLTGELALDCERVRAVRTAMPGVWMSVDANQGFGISELPPLLDCLLSADVELLEQPLARGRESDLDGFHSPIPLAADESAQTLADLPGLVGRFDVVNIKLDKCGGLTEGLAMARTARELGLRVMIGNMGGSSIAMAPAFVLAQLCDIVDIDGPIFLSPESSPTIFYDQGTIFCPEETWGLWENGAPPP